MLLWGLKFGVGEIIVLLWVLKFRVGEIISGLIILFLQKLIFSMKILGGQLII